MPRWVVVACLVCLGLLWRLWLSTEFYGWEESDYGNLAMVWGVLESGFTQHELDHMPLYYVFCALVMAVVGDSVIAAGLVSMLAGVVAMGLSIGLADRVFGRRVAIFSGLLMIVQPEFALYSASFLREPLYAAFIMWMLWELVSDRPLRAGLAAMAGFLVRFDGGLSLGFVLLGWVCLNRREWRRRVLSLVPLVLGILGWAMYYHSIEGTWAFWSHAAQTNVNTGLGEEATSRFGWWARGGAVSFALLTELLPSRIGWGIAIGAGFVVLAQARKRTESERLWVLTAVALVGCWAGIGFVAQHDANHNLYWKWLCPFVPVVIPVGVLQVLRWIDALKPVGWLGAQTLLVLILGQAGWVEQKGVG